MAEDEDTDYTDLDALAEVLRLPDSSPDFFCWKCGKECSTAPQSPARAICEECCEDHEYEYVPEERGHFCKHCNKPAPVDWFD